MIPHNQLRMSIFFLTCASGKEASKIVTALLKSKLIVCAKMLPTSSIFRWRGNINKASEVLLMMESIDKNFKKIEQKVKQLHSHETFVLFSLPVGQVTKNVKSWLKEELAIT